MISKRILSIFLDFLFTFLPAIVIYMTLKSSNSQVDFSIIFPIVYFMGTLIEVLYSKGLTAGMIITKIEPYNVSGGRASVSKVLLYCLVLSICLIPALNHIASLLLVIMIIIPLPFFSDPVSGFDFTFKVKWQVKEG